MDNPLTPLLEGFAEDRLRLPVCDACGKAHLYPRHRCPHCGGADFSWQEAQGRGEVASFSTVHRGPSPDFADEVPYHIAIVTLAEGPRLMAWVMDAPPEALRVGLPVALHFHTMPSGERRPVFVPTEPVS